MKWTHFVLLFLISIYLSSCEEQAESPLKESCDFLICEEGRANIDTLKNAYGIFRSDAKSSYIELTAGYTPDTFYISCMAPELSLPENGSYVKFAGFTKQICQSDDPMIQKDSLLLNEIEMIEPVVLHDCHTAITNTGYDKDLVDEKLRILNISFDENCVSILVSYTGGCSQQPIFALNNSGEILGEFIFKLAIQGLIDNDCSEESIRLLKYDLSSLGEIVPIREEEFFVLYFQLQGYFQVVYPHTYQ